MNPNPHFAADPPAPPRKSWLSGPAPIIALAVCGVAAMLLGIVTAAVGSSPNAADKGIRVQVTSCEMEDMFGSATVGLQVTNESTRTRTVRVEVEYRDGSGRRIDTDTAHIRDIAPGDTASHEETTILDGAPTGQGACVVKSVR